MDFLNNPVNQEEQMKQIIDDTDEIIKNFKDIATVTQREEYSDELMFNLGTRLIHNREEQTEPSIGNEQLGLIV